jgi:hypothetical protein
MRRDDVRKIIAVTILLASSGCSLPWVVNDPPEAFLDPDRPPALSIFPPLVDSEVAVEIPAFAYCWGPLHDGGVETCVDAEPRFDEVPVSLPAPGDVILTWMNLSGWSFTGSATKTHAPATATELAVRAEDDLVVTIPKVGIWDVTLQGQGPQGDATYAFRVSVGGAD